MKILLVGGAGYVGGMVTDLLHNDSNHQVTVLDNLLYEESYRKEVRFINQDVSDFKSMNKILKRFDIVVWMAGIVGDGACEIDKLKTYLINVESVKNLKKNFKGKIIFFSTCSVYGINNSIISEKAKLNPLSTYAKTKIEAEKILSDTNCVIFRLGTLFGISDTYSRIRMDLVVNILTMKAYFEKQVSVFGGAQFRPILHVKDVARAVICAINDEKNIGIYNLGFGNYKIIDIARKIKKILPETVINKEKIKFQDMRNYRVNSNKFSKKFNFDYKYDLEYGINEIIKLIKEKRIINFYNKRYSNINYLKD